MLTAQWNLKKSVSMGMRSCATGTLYEFWMKRHPGLVSSMMLIAFRVLK